MSLAPSSFAFSTLVTLMRTPRAGWAAIAAAPPPSARAVLVGCLGPLAVLAAACPALGRALFGETALGVTYRPPLAETVLGFALTTVLILAGLAFAAFVADSTAPAFRGERSFDRAFVLVGLSAVPALLATTVNIAPALWPLTLAGLYSIPLLVTGLPVMMRCPPDRATAYATVLVVCAAVALLVALALSACVATLT
jgi:hypothetical protein